MAFKIHTTDDGRVPGIEYLPAGAITPKVGMALTVSSGKLAVASGTTAPSYISMCERETACTAGELIPVIRVGKDMILETMLSADGSAVSIGDKVTLHTDGMKVTATKTGGVAELVYMDAPDVGAMCRVRF